MAIVDLNRDPDSEWLDHVPPVGLVVASSLLKELGLSPLRQTPIDTGVVAELIGSDPTLPALSDPWAFVKRILGWQEQYVAGAPGGPPLPDELVVILPEHGTALRPTWAIAEPDESKARWQLLVKIVETGIDPDARNVLDGWEATPHQRFERLLRDTGAFAGVLISERREGKEGDLRFCPEIRLVYAPRGETSGHQSFPIRPMGTVAGRSMLAGMKLLLDRFRLFSDSESRRLPTLLKRSRDAQAVVSTALAEQVLGALHELLRGLHSAEPAMVRELAASRPDHLYGGLLTVLMRLVFVLYAEDRDLLPSRSEARARQVYETSYSVRGLYAQLSQDAALNPDTMDERRGAWGRLLALFRLIHSGHKTRFVQARGGKLFDPDEFAFLEGRAAKDDPVRILAVADGCSLRILEGLMTLKLRGAERERLSYRTLDVEQIGSVYETVMGFTVEVAKTRVLAIKAGKNNRTPVFVALDDLLAKRDKDRIKELKQSTGRSISASQAKAIEAARSVEALAAALDSIVDERGSPRHSIAPGGTPILQPTDERRRTGSHYTPRVLTAPIVKYALQSAFERLGPDATAEQVLDLKVCDPAMGSGAFLVESCRAIGERLVAAWARWPGTRPSLPPDEDEDLHARRLVAQRCLHGVDKNSRAVDLARLSLWLATLARDHEFTFLDHALKCGDSLVGLTVDQIAAANWDQSRPGMPLFRQLLNKRVAEALDARAEIHAAPDDTTRAIQEARYRLLEGRLTPIRTMGDAVISAFFAADKPKAREKKRVEVESWLLGSLEGQWEQLNVVALSLRSGEHSIVPFHWEIEFPEVFARDNGGFDAIVGNPPFAGKNTLIAGSAKNYLPWLQCMHEGAHGNADLVAHFFRRAFALLRRGGVFGLIATNTIGQGDTRASGLTKILDEGGSILRATRRLKWPGEAAVVVSVVHVVRGITAAAFLDGRPANRISAYLVEGDLDAPPTSLIANAGKAFVGSYVLGAGFTFDDIAAAKGEAEGLETMRALLENDPKNAERIFPFIGGEEVNTNPEHGHHRYVIDFFDRPLCHDPALKPWAEMGDSEISHCRVEGVVPADYPGEVAEDWPDLVAIIRHRVKPERDLQKRAALRVRWWQYAEKRPGLYAAIAPIGFVLATNAKASTHLAVARLEIGKVFAQNLIIFAFSNFSPFAVLQSRVHECWARFFSSSMKDDLSYSPSDGFRTFPFPDNFQTDSNLEAAGETYHAFRAQLMIERDEGLTKTYNRFHARDENAPDIARLRALHAQVDAAVLRAYGWHDLADLAVPEFIEQDADEGKISKTRFDWHGGLKDELLARLLALNAERAVAEREAGLTPTQEDDDGEIWEGGEPADLS